MRTNQFGQPIGEPVEDWQGAALPDRRPLHGRYCRLLPLSAAEHGPDLHAAYTQADDGRLWTYMPVGPFSTEQDYLRWARDAEHSQDPLFFTIIAGSSSQPLGLASYLRMQPPMGVIEVGHIAYAPHLQRTRAATEAMYLMMARAFDGWGYRRYEWKCDALNAPSRAAATRLGFTYEGQFRQNVVYKGRNRDTAWYSITDREWPAVKQGFERWLAEGNFDADGQQRSSLVQLRAEGAVQ
ncbi:MAG: GNAT family protein [Pseudomonadota bacterium]